jgi:hypothetical protein
MYTNQLAQRRAVRRWVVGQIWRRSASERNFTNA